MKEVKKFELHDGSAGAAIAVRVVTRASRTEIAEILDDGVVKVRLTVAPVEGKANLALIKLLADVLDIAPSKIEIVAGHTGKDKLVTVVGLSPEQVQKRIIAHLQ